MKESDKFFSNNQGLEITVWNGRTRNGLTCRTYRRVRDMRGPHTSDKWENKPMVNGKTKNPTVTCWKILALEISIKITFEKNSQDSFILHWNISRWQITAISDLPQLLIDLRTNPESGHTDIPIVLPHGMTGCTLWSNKCDQYTYSHERINTRETGWDLR